MRLQPERTACWGPIRLIPLVGKVRNRKDRGLVCCASIVTIITTPISLLLLLLLLVPLLSPPASLLVTELLFSLLVNGSCDLFLCFLPMKIQCAAHGRCIFITAKLGFRLPLGFCSRFTSKMGCNSKILGRNDYSLIRLFLGCNFQFWGELL